jgi:glycosyltransferase involved in cell wall biosynthesis
MGFAGLQLGKRFSIPTVSSYTTNFTQYAAYYKADFLKQPVWEYLKWFHNENEITLCPSNEARNFILKNGIKNTAIFSRGIDLGQFHPSNRSDRFKREYDLQETFTFLYVGRVSPEKDLDLLNLSYRAMKGRYGDSISLVITGDGPYLEKYRGLFPKDVVFTGFKTGKDIAEIYASADAFVCTSSTETFGNVILEAMASGLPVIGADAGGIKEIIQHGENGLKFTARDYESLELAMEMIFLDESLRSALIAGSIETVERRSWTHVFSELSKVYESVKHEKIKQAISA